MSDVKIMCSPKYIKTRINHSLPSSTTPLHIYLFLSMANPRFSLPPAVYKIRSGDNYVTDPAADNDTLTLAADGSDQLVRCMMSSANIKFSSDANYIIQWLISGDGIIRSLAHDRKFASARLAPKTSGIIRSSSSLKWIIALTFVYSRVY